MGGDYEFNTSDVQDEINQRVINQREINYYEPIQSEINLRQSRVIDRLLDLIDRQAELVKTLQQTIKEKNEQIDVLIGGKIPTTTLTEAYEQARPNDNPNKPDIAETKQSDTLNKDRYINLLNGLLSYVRYVDVMYDNKVSKLFYLVSVKESKYMGKFAKQFNLKRPSNCDAFWSYDDLCEYTDLSFAVSYDWIEENFPALIPLIKAVDSNLKLVCRYVTKNLAANIQFKGDRAEMDPIKCQTTEDMFISDLFIEHFNAKYNHEINKIVMPIEDAKKVVELIG